MSEFIIDEHQHDPHDIQDVSGVARAKVGATKKQDLTWLKIGIIAVIVLIGVWFAYGLRGASFELKSSGSAQTLTVASAKWSATLPAGWKVERGSSKTELVAYPGTASDVRAAIRDATWIRFAWGKADSAADSATRQFKTELDKETAASSSVSEVQANGLTVTRTENPSGRVSLFVRHNPPLLVTTAKSFTDFETIASSLKGL